MQANFAFCLKEVLRHEGGWADHPRDPGGATMKGITIGTYSQWKGRRMSKDELRAISDAEIAAIYKRNYWDKVRGDDLPSGLDFVAFDAAVNSGPSRGAKWLQNSLLVTADGKIGPKTLAAANAADARDAINRALDIRLAFLFNLSTWPTFGKGWSRRVADVRKKALGLVKTEGVALSGKGVAVSPTPAEAPKRPAQRASAPKAPTPAKQPGGLAGLAVGGAMAAAGYAAAKWAEVTQAWGDFWTWAFSFIN